MLELRGIEKSFASQKALYPISLSIPSGEFFCLLGPSGCGKTTLLRILAGLELPDAGEIWLDGKRIDQNEARIRPFNTVFQSYALFPHLDVFNNIAFGPRLRRKDETWIKKNVGEMLEMVGLKGFESRWPSTLSGGQAQRIAMARALINEPEVLLLDEPLSALDPQLRAQMQEELRTIQKRSQTTFLMVTHDRDEAMTLSDRLALLNSGRVEQIGTPQDLYDKPTSAFVAKFFREVNEIKPGLFVRPEKMQITPDRTIGSTHCLSGLLQEVGFRGTHFESIVRLENGTRVNVMHTEPSPYAKDQKVFVSCAEGATLRFQA